MSNDKVLFILTGMLSMVETWLAHIIHLPRPISVGIHVESLGSSRIFTFPGKITT